MGLMALKERLLGFPDKKDARAPYSKQAKMQESKITNSGGANSAVQELQPPEPRENLRISHGTCQEAAIVPSTESPECVVQSIEPVARSYSCLAWPPDNLELKPDPDPLINAKAVVHPPRNYQTVWQWIPLTPVKVDALQYSVLHITQADREFAHELAMRHNDRLPEGSAGHSATERSLLAKTLACRFLALDPASQPFTTAVIMQEPDLFVNGAMVCVLTSPRRGTSIAVRAGALRRFDYALVIVVGDEMAHAAGYLSSIEIAALKNYGECKRSNTIAISYDVLKPWEWLAHEAASTENDKHPHSNAG